jgi:hypothetical protein
MNKHIGSIKKSKGIGTLALLAALLGSVCLVRVNGSSLYNYLFGLMDISNQLITPTIFIVLSVAGIELGAVKSQDWGARVGMVWCIVNAVLGFTLIVDLFSWIR